VNYGIFADGISVETALHCTVLYCTVLYCTAKNNPSCVCMCVCACVCVYERLCVSQCACVCLCLSVRLLLHCSKSLCFSRQQINRASNAAELMIDSSLPLPALLYISHLFPSPSTHIPASSLSSFSPPFLLSSPSFLPTLYSLSRSLSIPLFLPSFPPHSLPIHSFLPPSLTPHPFLPSPTSSP
jgi:hypothetical protein